MTGLPTYAPVAFAFFAISVSVSTSASAAAAGVGPFRGVLLITSTSLSITDLNGNKANFDNLAKNTILWVSGYASVIATATSQFGVL